MLSQSPTLTKHPASSTNVPLTDVGLIKWEDPKGKVCGPHLGKGIFPHLYNSLMLGKTKIKSVQVLENLKGEGVGKRQLREMPSSRCGWTFECYKLCW
ncbi:hypothetical protein JVU11DRAFT_12796 [Chiua virens]|nr:hypothetical protein JVU11DRAFT_12796 [Chiua virens]